MIFVFKSINNNTVFYNKKKVFNYSPFYLFKSYTTYDSAKKGLGTSISEIDGFDNFYNSSISKPYSVGNEEFKTLSLSLGLPASIFRSNILSYYWSTLTYYNQFRKKNNFKSELVSVKTFKEANLAKSSLTSKLGFKLLKDNLLLDDLVEREKSAWQDYIFKFRYWYNTYRFLNSKRTHIYSKAFFMLNKKLITDPAGFKKTFLVFGDSVLDQLKNLNLNSKSGTISAVTLNNIKNNIKNNLVEDFWSNKRLLDKKLFNKNNLLFDNLHYSYDFLKSIPWRSVIFWNIKEHSLLFKKRKFKKRFHIFRLERIFKQKKQKRKKVKTFLEYSHSRFHKFRLYYTTLGYRQFQNIFSKLQHFKKNASQLTLCLLELRLEYFLYRINFAPSKYFAKQMLSHGAFLVNGVPVFNKNFQLRVGDTLTVSESKFNLIFGVLYNRLNNMKRYPHKLSKSDCLLPIIFNTPDYCEADYSLLSVSILRNPHPFEVFVPEYIELDTNNRNLHHIYNSYL